MKTLFFIFIGSLTLLASSYSRGNCGCEGVPDCQQNSCSEPQNYCQCADINSGKNSCLSKSDYCRDFGNVGDNKL